MGRHLALRSWILACALLGLGLDAAAAPVTLPDFVVENAVPGVRFNTPTAIAFAGDRLLVAEKAGVVWVVRGGTKLPQPLWSGEREVLNNGDRGLLGLAVDPDFARNGFVYLLYTVDPDSNGVDGELASFGRLTRYRVSAADSNRVDPATRTVLIGATWREGFLSATLSHGVGSLRWGADGSLLISNGDGGHYDVVDAGGHDPAQFLPGRTDSLEDVGSFRAQQLESLSGKILRIDPATGAGYPGNPFYTGDPFAARSRVWSYGLRNPFRFCVRPGTGSPDPAAADPGTVYIGDVGLNLWEEIDVVPSGGLNLGWPCFEGRDPQPLYHGAGPAGLGCDALAGSAAPTPPTFAWHHLDSTLSEPHGLHGNCAAGGAFYTGSLYPTHYRGRLFFGEFGKGWLRVATMDSLDRIVQLQEFATGLEGPVDWATDPASGDLHYVSIYTGEVRRFRYAGQSGAAPPPVAYASAAVTIGAAPATLAFSSLGSFDPAGEPMTLSWNFGDGDPTGAGDAHPTHVFRQPGEFAVILTAATPRGAIARDTVEVVIAVAPAPATAILDSLGGAGRPLGSPWAGSIAGLAITRGALMQSTPSSNATWNGAVFGPNQEVHVRFDSVSATALEQDLLLKVQGTSWTAGAIQVVYSASQTRVVVNTYTPGTGWQRRAGPWSVRLEHGDQLGARTWSNGMIEIHRNGTAIGAASIAGWPFARAGGRIGLMLREAAGARLTRFGGGDFAVRSNLPPAVTITEPADGRFYVVGDSLRLRLSASDAEDPAAALGALWSVDLVHNNHVHPNVYVHPTAAAAFLAEGHDDGTGVHYRIRAIAIDRGGLSDTASIEVFPEIDLEAGPVTVSGGLDRGVAFTLHNRGRMPSPLCRWTLTAGGAPLAQGDTLIGALDSVRVTRPLATMPDAGVELALLVDALDSVRETDETDNRWIGTWEPHPFPATAVLDAFERSGPLGAPWACAPGKLAVAEGALASLAASAYAVWNGAVFAPDQEAWLTLEAIADAAPEHDLLLKVQGTTWTAGAIQVAYSAPQGTLKLNTYSPGAGWVRRGGPWPARLLPGDRLGARATADGRVRIHVNGALVAESGLGDWPFATAGGRIGLLLQGAQAARLADFGGGSAPPPTPPRAFPTTPALDAFARADGPVGSPWISFGTKLQVVERALASSATNAYGIWNGATFGADQEAWFRLDAVAAEAPEHDLLLKVQGTSWTGGAIQVVYAAPKGVIVVNTYTPGTGWQRRGGPWPARLEPGDEFGARAFPDGRVRVYRNGVALGEASLGPWPFAGAGGRIGLLLLGAQGSRIGVFGGGDAAGPGLAAGGADSLAARRDPAAGATPDSAGLAPRGIAPPTLLALSAPRPNPARGQVAFILDLPRAARVRFSLLDIGGRRVWSGTAGERAAGRHQLSWSGADERGTPVSPGVYLALVEVDGTPLVRRVTLIR